MASVAVNNNKTGGMGDLFRYALPLVGLVVFLTITGMLPNTWGFVLVAVGWVVLLYANKRQGEAAQRGDGILDMFAPQWGVNAHSHIIKLDERVRAVFGILLGLLVLMSLFLLFGGGYTSIQGVRIPLAALLRPFGKTVATEGLPGFAWWLIPVANTFIQVTARRIPALKPFWAISIVFDATTTSIFLSLAISTALAGTAAALGLVQCAVLASAAGLLFSLMAEQFLLAAALCLRGVVKGE